MNPPVVNLLTLPCAGASAGMYARWRRGLPAWVRLVQVELPGRGARLGEAFVESFDGLVAQLCDEQAAAMRGRYALLGHSMGALLAYGMARRQHVWRRPLPSLVVVSACAAPSRRSPDRCADKGDDAALIADLRRQGGTPEEVFENAELLRITLDALGADYRICESFDSVSGDPLPVPFHALGGTRDSIATDAIEDWRHEAAGPFSVSWFDGGHFFIKQQEQSVVATVSSLLQREFAGIRHVAAGAA